MRCKRYANEDASKLGKKHSQSARLVGFRRSCLSCIAAGPETAMMMMKMMMRVISLLANTPCSSPTPPSCSPAAAEFQQQTDFVNSTCSTKLANQ